VEIDGKDLAARPSAMVFRLRPKPNRPWRITKGGLMPEARFNAHRRNGAAAP
jgi:hypothetical protein